jgi:citrate lyase beta subunit
MKKSWWGLFHFVWSHDRLWSRKSLQKIIPRAKENYVKKNLKETPMGEDDLSLINNTNWVSKGLAYIVLPKFKNKEA